MKNKKIKIVLAVVVLVWACFFSTDFVRVGNFEKPIFSVLVNGADDGGSGTYVGFGYWTQIEGNFVTENEAERGVIQYDMKLLGIRVQAAIRCLASSNTYSQEDIQQAMDTVVEHFVKEFKGCDLQELWYDEAFSEKCAQDWAEQYEAEEAIILLSNFYVHEHGAEGCFNPDYTYKDWSWILVRDEGDWELKTWGY